MKTQNANLKPINNQFLQYVIPAVIAMGIQAFYTVLNGIIAGRGIGEVALGAVNIVLPFSMVTIALAMLIGIGGANVYSFYKGQGHHEKANNIFCQCLTLSAMIGIVLALFSFIFREELALFLGANQEMLPSVTAYLKWLSPFLLMQMVIFVLTVFLRNDGAPKLVMIGSIVSAVINLVLDIIFIMILHYGIEVIAITNNIAVLAELLIFIPRFVLKKGTLRIRKPKMDFGTIKRIVNNGIASFLMEFWLSAISLSFNLALVHTMGTLGVSAYSIVNYISALIQMVLAGVTQGTQPLMSFYRGRGDKKAFLHIFRLGLFTNTALPLLLSGVCIALGSGIVLLFNSDNPELATIAVHMLRIYPLGFIFAGPVLMNVLFFQTIERNLYATLISFLRCIGFVQVFLFLFMYLFGADGICFSFLAGELCHFIISQILVVRTMRKDTFIKDIQPA